MEQNNKSFLEKWKAGIEKVTPLQRLEATQRSNWIMIVGLIAGMIVMLWKLKDFWWIELILGASLFNQVMTMIGMQQQIKAFRKVEEIMLPSDCEKEVE
jgi:membrane glycosyltransferase